MEEVRLKASVTPQRILMSKCGGKNSINDAWGIASCYVHLDRPYEGEIVKNDYNNITISGHFKELKIGYRYVINGILNEYRGKLSYKIDFVSEDIDLTKKEDQRSFLERILTPTQVKNLYDITDEPFKWIHNKDYEKLMSVKGIGEKTVTNLLEKYDNNAQYTELYVALAKYKFTNEFMNKIINKFDDMKEAIDIIKNNPYKLMNIFENFGFNKADKIARTSMISYKDIKRLRAFVEWRMEQLAYDGKTWVSTFNMFDTISKEAKVYDKKSKIEVMRSLVDSGILMGFDDNKKIALSKYYHLERKIANELYRLYSSENKIKVRDYMHTIKEIEEDQGWEYTDEQRKFIDKSMNENVIILTGGQGVGKTATSKAVLHMIRDQGFKVFGTSLAGRASQNLQESTGIESHTTHSLLGFNGEKFIMNKENKIPMGLYVVDELSIYGADLFYKLIQSIPNGSKVIMLGDYKQLESIGLGNVLKDIMYSKKIPVVELTIPQRQALESGITSECFKIREGQQLFDVNFEGCEVRGKLNDFHLNVYKSDNVKNIKKDIVEKYVDLLKNSSLEDIQVISPLKFRGDTSCYNLNTAIQNKINPHNENKKQFIFKKNNLEHILRVGDRVKITFNEKLQDVNEKEIKVFNGNFGELIDIDKNFAIIKVFFINKKVLIPKEKLKKIELGYASSTHAQQGSGINEVVYVLTSSCPPNMLVREQPYTGASRGKKNTYIYCENQAMRKAISTTFVSEKQTFLKDKIEEVFSN